MALREEGVGVALREDTATVLGRYPCLLAVRACGAPIWGGLHGFPRIRNKWNRDAGEGFTPVCMCLHLCESLPDSYGDTPQPALLVLLPTCPACSPGDCSHTPVAYHFLCLMFLTIPLSSVTRSHAWPDPPRGEGGEGMPRQRGPLAVSPSAQPN